MKIRRFVAKDMRTALAQIKEELGSEAVIMSNNKIAEGVELMAAIDCSQVTAEKKPSQPQVNEAMPSQPQVNEAMSARDVSNDIVTLGAAKTVSAAQTAMPVTEANNNQTAPVDSLSALLQRQVQQKVQAEPSASKPAVTPPAADSIEQQFKSFTERLRQSGDDTDIVETCSDEMANIPEQARQLTDEMSEYTPPVSATTSVSQDDFDNMQKEMASIRQLLEHQVSGLMWQDMAQKDPRRAVLVNRLMDLGLTEQIADQIAGYVPAKVHDDEAWEQALHLMSQQLNTTNNDIIQRGGVVALVGPTGVGKTTTIAKLAARFAQLHGADQVALISTDTFRIAGFEQLSTYGRIIGCQVKLAKDSQALNLLLQQFANKKLVLIDTAGMGQRDMRLSEHLSALLANSRIRIRNYLVLSANTQQRVMQENVERFKKVPLSGAIYTKLDESISIGEIITTSIQNGLPIGYLTDGQRVPEDIKVANAVKLVRLADKMANKLAFSNAASLRTMPVTHSEVI